MRRLLSAGLVCCLVALPLVQACATAQNTGAIPSTPYSSASAGGVQPVSNLSATTEAANQFDPSGYKVDSSESKALSDYLTQHKLPLVGAQVMRGPDHQRGVVLYGFVGSDYGKQDAVKKARNFLSDSAIAVNNRIKVNPELLTSNSGAASSAVDGDGGNGASSAEAPMPAYPGADSYTQNQQSEANQYVQNQHNNATLSSMAPVLMLGMMALSVASGGGGFSVGGGPLGPSGSSSFGAAPYSQYPGYPSPPPYSPYGP